MNAATRAALRWEARVGSDCPGVGVTTPQHEAERTAPMAASGRSRGQVSISVGAGLSLRGATGAAGAQPTNITTHSHRIPRA